MAASGRITIRWVFFFSFQTSTLTPPSSVSTSSLTCIKLYNEDVFTELGEIRAKDQNEKKKIIGFYGEYKDSVQSSVAKLCTVQTVLKLVS